jgi:hypothetical protein
MNKIKTSAMFACLLVAASVVAGAHDASAQVLQHGTSCFSITGPGDVRYNGFGVGTGVGAGVGATIICPLSFASGTGDGITTVNAIVYPEAGADVSCTLTLVTDEGDTVFTNMLNTDGAPRNEGYVMTWTPPAGGHGAFGYIECTLPGVDTGLAPFFTSYWAE